MLQGAQNLVAAWQTVDITQQFRLRPLEPAAYHYSPGLQYLCSVRGGDSSTVAVWDLHQEREVTRMSVVLLPHRAADVQRAGHSTADYGLRNTVLNVRRVFCAEHRCLLFAVCSY